MESSSENVKVTNLEIGSDKISFNTDKPNELHIIKVSYFPN